MKNNYNDLSEKYHAIMEGFNPRPFIPSNWTMENGVYKQYSAYEKSDNSVSGTSYCY